MLKAARLRKRILTKKQKGKEKARRNKKTRKVR
jgi:hypothetical protein